MNQLPSFSVIAVLVGLFAGGLLAMQPSVNGLLGRSVAHPLQASLISFASGTAILILVLCVTRIGLVPHFQVPIGKLPWWTWTGGAIGVVMVTTSLLIVPRIGSLPWFAAVMTGQTLAALYLDHHGLLGNPRAPVSMLRVIGTMLLILGVFVIVAAKRMEQNQGGDHVPRQIEP